MILALENLCDLQNQSCCLPEHTSNQPWPPPSSRGHECLCCFPPALWAPGAQKSPAGIAQHVPLPFHTQGSFSWRRFAGGAADYRPGCLQLPCAWLALATRASAVHHQLLPPATLPCSLSSQQTNVVSAGCCLLPGHISAAPKVLQLFREAGHSHKGSQPEKKLSSERMVFFCPPSKQTKKPPQKPKGIPTNLSNLCLLNISSSQASFEFYWFICVPCDRLINARFSHLCNTMPGLAEMSLFQNVDFRPNNLSVLVNSCTSKTGTKYFCPFWSLLERAVFLPEALGSIYSSN